MKICVTAVLNVYRVIMVLGLMICAICYFLSCGNSIDAKITAIRCNLKSISENIENYRKTNGIYPETLTQSFCSESGVPYSTNIGLEYLLDTDKGSYKLASRKLATLLIQKQNRDWLLWILPLCSLFLFVFFICGQIIVIFLGSNKGYPCPYRRKFLVEPFMIIALLAVLIMILRVPSSSAL